MASEIRDITLAESGDRKIEWVKRNCPLLRSLEEEIPHGIAVSIESMKERGRICDIEATIVCERDSHKGIIIGKGGAMLKKIGSNARYEIERMLDAKVNLKLWVKVKKDWRDSDYLIKNFGYNKDEI